MYNQCRADVHRVTGGDPTATGMTQSSCNCFSPLTQAPDIAPLHMKFTSFSYQIASGMVSIGYAGITHVHIK